MTSIRFDIQIVNIFSTKISRCCGTRIRVEMSSGRSRRDDRKGRGGGGGGGRNRYRYVLKMVHFKVMVKTFFSFFLLFWYKFRIFDL